MSRRQNKLLYYVKTIIDGGKNYDLLFCCHKKEECDLNCVTNILLKNLKKLQS